MAVRAWSSCCAAKARRVCSAFFSSLSVFFRRSLSCAMSLLASVCAGASANDLDRALLGRAQPVPQRAAGPAPPRHDRDVLLAHRSRLELARERRVRVAALGEDQHARGVSVEPLVRADVGPAAVAGAEVEAEPVQDVVRA